MIINELYYGDSLHADVCLKSYLITALKVNRKIAF